MAAGRGDERFQENNRLGHARKLFEHTTDSP